MKQLVPTLIILGIATLAAIILLRGRNGQSVEKMWDNIVNSKDANSEAKNINALTEWVTSKKGYWEVLGMLDDGQQVKMVNYKGKLETVKSISINLYWNSKEFNGGGWIPKGKENIYQFLMDK